MPVITRQDVVDQYHIYRGRDPSEDEIRPHVGQSVPSIPDAAYRFFMPQGMPSGGGGGFEFPEFEMSPEEKEHFNLLNDQIREQIRISKEENARTAKRRSALEASVLQQYGIPLETFEAQEAFRAAQTSRAQGERVAKALAGELPVDPALERQIGEDEKTIRAKLLEQVGPGYETSTPGIQSLADFRQRAEELRSAARKDEIAAGLSPAAASAQFGLSLIGNEQGPDTTSIAQGLQAAIGSRQASIQASQVRAQAMIAMQEMQQRERLALLDADLARQRFSGSSGGDTTVRTGAGAGRFVGSTVGAAVPTFFQRRSSGGDPFYT